MRLFALALLLAGTGVSAPVLAAPDGGIQHRKADDPRTVMQVADRGDHGSRGGGRGGGGWNRGSSPAPAASAPSGGGWQGRSGGGGNWGGGNARQAPAAAPAQSNWQGRGGNWNRPQPSASTPSAPVQERRWRGNDGARSGGDYRRSRPNAVVTPPGGGGVYDRNRDGRTDRQWDRNRDGAIDRQWDRNRNGVVDRNWDRNRNGTLDRRYDRNRDGRYDRQGYDRRGNDWRGNDNRHDWNHSWRNDRRYDWNSYRNHNRNYFRQPRYYNPYGYDYGYRRFGVGFYLDSLFYSNSYWINDPWSYRLPAAYGSYRWVRYYDDVLLVDMRTGYVVDVIHNFFW